MHPALRVLGGLMLAGVGGAGATWERWPESSWPSATPAEAGLNAARLEEARNHALTGGGAGCVIRHGQRVLTWGDLRQRFDLKSTTKSIGVTALGLALLDGRVTLDDRAAQWHPGLDTLPDAEAPAGWRRRITLRMLANQTAGFEKPGGSARLLFEPGTRWHYSDSGPNWLAECLTLRYRRDLSALLFERVFGPLGITADDLTWRENSYRSKEIEGIPRREFGAGISANVEAMSRIGYLYLRRGRWQTRQVVPAEFVEAVSRPGPELAGVSVLEPAPPAEPFGEASAHYGLLWWNNHDGTLPGVPRDAYWSWGLYDSLIIVVPSLDLVAVRAGRSWARTPGAGHYAVLRPFLEPLCAAAAAGPTPARAPFAPSPVIAGIRWAPTNTIIRLARGSDNWPLTTSRQGSFAAFGDGQGFEPFRGRKLSLGLARVLGAPPAVSGVNLRSPTLEASGDGASGRKASGLLALEGTLYILVRNVGNAQLGWSHDHGATWTWAGWKFTASFGCPTFLNFGPDYAGARDEMVYVFSPDTDSAYARPDRMVLARVAKNRLRDRAGYEFFTGMNATRGPEWSPVIDRRGAVLTWPGRCYRSGVTFNVGLRRYLWCLALPGTTRGSDGGLAILDAAEPWGPWTLAFQAEPWDVDPGETASIPDCWRSADGRTVHLLFSGEDSFSVRRAELLLRPGAQAGP